MIPTKATVIVFSATGTSRKSAMAIAKGLGCPVEVIDVTAFADTLQSKTFGPEEIVIFGAPCYGGRIPRIAMPRLSAFKGEGTPCIVTTAYGNRDFDDALVELCDMAKDNGFIPVGAAALVAQHTFGAIAVGRPNAEDLAEDEAFGRKVLESLADGIVDKTDVIPGNRPYKDGGSGGKFRPSTLDNCINCGTCRKACPAGAIGEDNKTIDNDKCISCFRCIAVCPMKAKAMQNPAYDEFCVGFNERLAARQESKFFL